MNVDDYFAGVPEPALGMLKKIRAALTSSLPRDATETISYGIPAFRTDVVLVWYAAFADHCSLFPTRAVIDAFEPELRGFRTSKGTIRFAIGERLPISLIKRIVKARAAQAGKKKRR
jgi:uncharacterized protein YdhG (YjbR/CyaY superfamily)